jgi:UDP:flavonoid glycosyltransferase YjiC (YdhE family)
MSADRLAALGVARILQVPEVNRQSVGEAMQAVLADPTYRQRASDIRADIAAMPSPAEVARILVERIPEWAN